MERYIFPCIKHVYKAGVFYRAIAIFMEFKPTGLEGTLMGEEKYGVANALIILFILFIFVSVIIITNRAYNRVFFIRCVADVFVFLIITK